MKNLNEVDERCFLSEKEALDFYANVCNTDIWKRCYTNELEAMPIDNAPILMEQIITTLGIAPDVSTTSIQECMESYNLGLNVPFDNGLVCYPIGDTAFSTLIQRAGYQNSPVLTGLNEKNSQKVMAPCDKASVLNTGFKCFKNRALVLIRDEKVRAVLSGDETDYSILRYNELVTVFKDELAKQFKGVSFEEAYASHSSFTTVYSFHDEQVYNAVEHIFAKKLNKIRTAVRMTSSDVGLSGANLYPYIIADGRTFLIGQPLSLTHKDRHSVDDFRDNAAKVMSMFKDAEEKLEKMETAKVRNVAGCFLRAAKQVGLPKGICCEYAPTLENLYGTRCYQIDIYWALYDMLEKYLSGSDATNARKLALEEGISRVVFSNMADYDLPFQWE